MASGGDLAAPEQRGIVSAAMGVATSVGVASGDSPVVDDVGGTGGRRKTEETWRKIFVNQCLLMFMEIPMVGVHLQQKCGEHEFGRECALPFFLRISGM